MCVQHIKVKMWGRGSFALTHAARECVDGDPSLLCIAFCLLLIAWLLLPSSLSPANVYSFLMASGLSLLCSFYPCLAFISSSATKPPTAGRSLRKQIFSPAKAPPPPSPRHQLAPASCRSQCPLRLAGSWAARPDEHT